MTAGAASANLDLTICVLDVDADALAAAIAGLGPFVLEQPHDAAAGDAAGRVPICIELWDVREGRVRPGGVDQDQWYKAGAVAMGSALGAWLGPIGAWSGALMGHSMGQALSKAATQTLGRYRELLIGIPNVRFHGTSHYFVAGMYTDSVFAQATDRMLGYGFGKQLAGFEGAIAGGLQVRSATQQSLLRTRLSEPRADALQSDDELEWAVVTRWLERPLLSCAAGRVASATLAREWPVPNTPRAHRAEIELGAGFHPWLSERSGLSASTGLQAARAWSVPGVRVSLGLPTFLATGAPRHVA